MVRVFVEGGGPVGPVPKGRRSFTKMLPKKKILTLAKAAVRLRRPSA